MTETSTLPPLPPKWTGSYRKRPVVVEAVQLIDDLRNHTEVARWIERSGGHCEIPFAEPCLFIQTPDGLMKAGIGWWVVKEADGSFRCLVPDDFERDYEPAGDRDALGKALSHAALEKAVSARQEAEGYRAAASRIMALIPAHREASREECAAIRSALRAIVVGEQS